MKNTLKIVALTALAAYVLGCSGSFNQDPLAGQDLNGDLPGRVDSPKGDDPSILRIDALDVMAFTEGVASEYAISGRMLLPGFTTAITIENLAEFPGATYNQQTGKFRWAPASSFVGSGAQAIRDLRISIIATPTNPSDVVRSTSEVKKILVTTSQETPTWVSVTQLDRKVFENQKRDISVTFNDTKANPNDPASFAKIAISSPTSTLKNLSPFVTVKTITHKIGSQYEGILTVNLTGIEATSNFDDAEFKVQTVNRLNLMSPPETVSLRIYTDLKDPQILWESPTFTVGVPNRAQFVAYNPKFEGTTSVRVLNMPWGGTANCVPAADTRVVCTLSATPTAVPTNGSFALQMEVKSQAGDPLFPITRLKNYTGNIAVVP